MMKVRLKAIVYQCDFRKADRSIFAEFAANKSCPGELGAGEVYLFVSGSEQQLIWWFRPVQLNGGRSSTFSYRSRLDKRTPWNPLMLQSYAEAVGLELQGIRSFKQAFNEQRAHVREVRRQQREALAVAKLKS